MTCYFNVFAILFIILFGSCKNGNKFQNSYELELIDSMAVVEIPLKEAKLTAGVYLQKDILTDDMFTYLLHRPSMSFIKINIYNDAVDTLYKYAKDDFEDIYGFNIYKDKLIINKKNILFEIVNNDLKIIDSTFNDNIYIHDSNYSPILQNDSFIILNYALAGPENNSFRRDTFSSALIPLNDKSSPKYFGKVLDDSIRKNAYYISGMAAIAHNKIYAGLMMSDSLSIYNYQNSDLKLLEYNVPIFTDYTVKYKNNTPPEYVGTDMIKLNEYLHFFSFNYFATQFQDDNNAYIIKKLPVNDLDSANTFLLGHIKDDTYQGYAVLPNKFYQSLYVIYNDDLYIINDGFLYFYKIKPLKQ